MLALLSLIFIVHAKYSISIFHEPVVVRPVPVVVSGPTPLTVVSPQPSPNKPNESEIPPQANNENDPLAIYQPCPEATQRLKVPEQIDLTEPADFSSSTGPSPDFTFLFSERGIDVYAVRTNQFGPAGYDRLALLVFQDEKIRQETLRSYITSGIVKWAYSDGENQNWKPIVNLKYATLDFRWFQRETGMEPAVKITIFYAPAACDSVSEPAGARPSSMIGVYLSPSPVFLSHDSFRYRVAEALNQYQLHESR